MAESRVALRLTEHQFRRELERIAREMHVTGALARQAIDEITAIHLHTMRQASFALTSGPPTPTELDELKQEYLDRLEYLTRHADSAVFRLAQQVLDIPPPPEKIGPLERLDRALLGEPDSGVYQLADRLTLGLFRKKR